MKILNNVNERWIVHLAVGMLNGRHCPRFDHPHVEEALGSQVTRQVKGEFLRTFRRLVDQWIDSGKDESDHVIDTPHDRNVEKVPPGYEKSLIEILGAWYERNPPRVLIKGDGRVAIAEIVSHNLRDPASYARDLAFHELARLLDSPTRERLSRCDLCSTYFERRRTPKRNTPIKRGAFCEKCKSKSGARRTSASREQRTKEMVEWAADRWLNWKPRHGKKAEWIAEHVNRELDRRHRIHHSITGKWVTQNKKSIEAEVERRNHAKS
jgi:hypothetical protein